MLRVLAYHRILSASAARACNPSTISADPDAFARQMRYLARGYRVVSAEQVLEALRARRRLPPRAVFLTFDDGCRDFGEVAWPVLRRLGLPATVFVPTAYPGEPDRGFWWERLHRAVMTTKRSQADTPLGPMAFDTPGARRASLRAVQQRVKTTPHADVMRLVEQVCRELGDEEEVPSQVLTWNELRELASDGVTICAHSHTHPALTQLPRELARAEIQQSRLELVRELGRTLPVFAYPFGDHDDAVVELVREEGFEIAVTCLDGHNRLGVDDPCRLCRTNITPRTTPFVFATRLTSLGAHVDRWRHRATGVPAGHGRDPRKTIGRSTAV